MKEVSSDSCVEKSALSKFGSFYAQRGRLETSVFLLGNQEEEKGGRKAVFVEDCVATFGFCFIFFFYVYQDGNYFL